MRNFRTYRTVRWPLFLSIVGGMLCSSVAIRADIVELSYGDSKGDKSATGYILQGSRNMKRLGKRRSTTSSAVLPPLSLETLSRKVPEPSDSQDPKTPKPRFGYGSDYQAEGSNEAVVVPRPSGATTAPISVDATTAVRFLPVRQNRSYYPRVPYYGYSSPPYFYRPGSAAGRYYLNSPNCYSGGISGSARVNVYHGGNLTFSSWSPVFGYRYYR